MPSRKEESRTARRSSSIVHTELDRTESGTRRCKRIVSSAEEQDTIDRARTGDQAAFDKLFHTHRDRITTTVTQRTKDPDNVDDLVQISFLRADRSLRIFRGDAAFSTWLTRITLNAYITHHHGKRAMLPEAVLETEHRHLPQAPSPEDELHQKERQRERVDRCIGRPFLVTRLSEAISPTAPATPQRLPGYSLKGLPSPTHTGRSPRPSRDRVPA